MGTVNCPMFRFSKAIFTWVLKRSKFGYNLKRSFLGGLWWREQR